MNAIINNIIDVIKTISELAPNLGFVLVLMFYMLHVHSKSIKTTRELFQSTIDTIKSNSESTIYEQRKTIEFYNQLLMGPKNNMEIEKIETNEDRRI